MSRTAAAESITDSLAAALRGEELCWPPDTDPGLALARVLDEDLAGLLNRQLGRIPGDCPAEFCERLARAARERAAQELLLCRELSAVLDALARRGVRPVLVKGTALAYLVYPEPGLRPRNDTDLMIPRDAVEVVREILAGRGYAEPVYCDGEVLFCQFELQKTDRFGVRHALDFHWKISTQAAFADILTYDELAASGLEVPALGNSARAAGTVHALLLACVHPVMHHRNTVRLIWLYDIHLLAGRMTPSEWKDLTRIATERSVAGICAHQLGLAAQYLATDVPEWVGEELRRPDTELTASYLASGRRWHHELESSLRALPRWRDRLRLLREVAFPRPGYMLDSYRIAPGLLSTAALPFLYAHRGARGLWRVVAGKK